jgi:hypothetical protein
MTQELIETSQKQRKKPLIHFSKEQFRLMFDAGASPDEMQYLASCEMCKLAAILLATGVPIQLECFEK